MDEQEREQNKRINHHQRLINDLRERLKTVEVDVEPDGRIIGDKLKFCAICQ